MKTRKVIPLFLLLALFPLPETCAAGQGRPPGYPMYFEAHDGDTTFFDSIDPVWVFPRGRRMRSGDWRRQHRLVYNFNKVYPYALVGRKMMHQVDSILAVDVTRRRDRSRYTHDVEMELFRLFEKDLRSMTVTQGMILMRLVDRECGMSPYEIIRNYRSGFAASFWQLVAKMFGADLKRKYDPAGKDARIEELVKIWDSGQWDAFYYSVFLERPRKTVIKTERLQSSVRKN